MIRLFVQKAVEVVLLRRCDRDVRRVHRSEDPLDGTYAAFSVVEDLCSHIGCGDCAYDDLSVIGNRLHITQIFHKIDLFTKNRCCYTTLIARGNI